MRRATNTISKLERADGTMVEDEQEFEQIITDFFRTCFRPQELVT